MDVDAEDWDVFKSLNAKRGLHRLKKALRRQRVPVEILMGDALDKDKESCPRDKELTALDDANKKKQLKQICGRDPVFRNMGNLAHEGRCLISSCYFRDVDDFYDVLSDAKDEAEDLSEFGQSLSQKKLQKVDEKWKAFHARGTLRKLAMEFSSCLKAGAGDP